jgi:hypothetical protein
VPRRLAPSWHLALWSLEVPKRTRSSEHVSYLNYTSHDIGAVFPILFSLSDFKTPSGSGKSHTRTIANLWASVSGLHGTVVRIYDYGTALCA